MIEENKKKYLKIFLEFMKTNHCLHEFLFNCFEQYQIEIKNISDLEKYFENKNYTTEIINFSFSWIETKQGHTYWNKLNRRLVKLLLEIDEIN